MYVCMSTEGTLGPALRSALYILLDMRVINARPCHRPNPGKRVGQRHAGVMIITASYKPCWKAKLRISADPGVDMVTVV